ncbi:phage tail protein [Citrobacter freundii]|uniref:phage tail-collar fiber domain-containing protein n=1 Tax=Citrobacter freundii TaxID=546 RepID=UPI001F1F1B6E|nr:phage tail protein [Citrobacter freundii]
MSKKFKTIITTAGAEKLAAATVPGGKKVNLTAMAVGDGGGTLPEPDAGQTKLINEVWRHALNKVSQDNKNKNYIVAELVIPPDVGGFWMRELGLYDDAGTLIAVANMAESYKPKLAEGSGRAQTCRMVIIVSNVDSVALSIDATTVMATQDYVDDKIAEHEKSRNHPDATLNEKGFTQLSSATDSTSETLAATPKAVKAAYDLADGKYTAQDASTAQKGIVQLSSATDSNDEGKAATPKAVKAAYDLANGKYTAQDASTTQKGIVQLSSATDSNDEGKAATPKAVKIAMDNANARLEKERNGSDIPNPQLFLQNIGLGKTDSPEFGGLKAPSITLRDGKISFLSSEDGKIIAITVNGESVAEIKAEHIFHKRALVAGEFLQAPKFIFRDGDINFYSGPGNLVMQVGGNDVATLTPDGFYHVKQVAATESLKAPKVILRDGDVNLIGGANNLVIQVGGNDIASLTPGNNFFKGKLTAETSLQVGSTCILATDGNLTGSKWGGWLDAFMKDGMSTDGNGLWWDAFSSQLQFRVGGWSIPDAAGGAGTSVTFPKAFKNGCLMVIPIPGNGGASQQIGSQSYSASGAVLQKGASDNNPRSGKYLAIGY